MRYLKRFNESDSSEYLKSEDFYKDLTDRLYLEIDDYFKEKERFFPLNIKLNRTSDGEYFGSVCMGFGWGNRMNDEEEDWLFSRLRSYRDRFGIVYSACADSFGGGDEVYNIENRDWPMSSHDYLNFPPDPFPGRYD